MSLLRSLGRDPVRGWRAGVFASFAAVILLWAGLGCGADTVPTPEAPVETGGMEASHSFNAADKRQLVAFADNVFVGRVIKRTGSVTSPTSSPDTRVPETQSGVEVMKSIKGELEGTVTVSQFGGPVDVVVERAGRRVTEREVDLFQSDPLLKPGEVVVLATRRNPSRDWHTIVAQPFANRRARNRAERDRLVREFTQARKAQRAP